MKNKKKSENIGVSSDSKNLIKIIDHRLLIKLSQIYDKYKFF